MSAQFTLLRAALENAATAVFLLAPEERNVRIFRSLRVEWGDVVDHHNMLEQMRQQPKVSRAARKTELQAVAKAQGMSEAEVAQVAARPLSFSLIVERAGVEAFGEDLGYLTLTIWMLNSGATHGKQWESITKIDRAQLLTTADLDVKQGRVTAAPSMIHHNANGAIIATTSRFSRAATAFAEGKSITLIDGAQLLYLLKEHLDFNAIIEI